MSETRYKLHWITAIIEVMKTAKEAILPIIVLVFANGLNDLGSGKWYLDYLTFIIFGVLIIAFFITGIIKWKRFEYWFEDNELRIEYGLFVKKKRYIPFDRIQSLDYTEGILHRPFRLVKVKVETAGSSSLKKSEAELTAITKEAASRIEKEIAQAKSGKKAALQENSELTEENLVVEESQSKSIFTMSSKGLLVLATTSGGIGIILSGVGIFLSQFAEMIPFEWMYEEISGFIKFGLLIVAITVFLGFLLVWGLSVAMTFLAYYGFNVSLEKEDIVITRGLLEKKRMTVPLNRVQSVRIIENPFRQLFGYAAVVIDSAGGGGMEGARINLFPLVKKTEVYGPLKEIFPNLILEESMEKLPARSKHFFYRVDFLWMIPAIGALTYFFFPYGLLSLLIMPIIVLFGLWQHRSSAYKISGNQLTIRFRSFNLQTAYLMKKRIQSMEMKQNYFQKRKSVATLAARIKSGMTIFNAQVHHMEESEAEKILSWYEKNSKDT
ncbi:PH domain-containing protein [Sporosarcina sp. ANT_H38]|uniref:PH domain-containing protein n=1 Tax=Sporosarcina sp. ANT_H38 TaxID=2597358 RepID=UPI0011F2A319|nr:PH domain-containing protein [Sporosarcina sp. ANT_H38]KAA0948424.1 PH domain-containing protein [Sporosarcina sp. ANT_H38]